MMITRLDNKTLNIYNVLRADSNGSLATRANFWAEVGLNRFEQIGLKRRPELHE